MSIIKSTLKSVRLLISNGVLYILRKMVSIKDEIIFISTPDYSDNALALSDYLSTSVEGKEYKCYWLVDDVYAYRRQYAGTGITFLTKKNKLGMMPLRTIKHHLQARFVFATHSFLIPQDQAKPEQRYILLWHGCGFKAKTGNHYTRFDKALVPGPLFVESKSKYWNVSPDHLLPKGYPRYDWMLHPSQEAKQFFRELKKDYNKVIFWLFKLTW